MPPQIIFGTASFGMEPTGFLDAESVKEVFDTLRELGISRLDTAARYPPLNPGRSEELIGKALELDAHSDEFVLDTKIYTDTRADGSGDLKRDVLNKSITSSLERLKRPQVHVIYSHRPDPSTPLEEQIQGFNEQIAEGHSRHWGVSNTPPQTLLEIIALCEKNGWQKPTCYQGSYNAMTRAMETKLLPILRAHGIAFVAYQVLMAGFLTGKLVNNEHANTRFGDSSPLGPILKKVFGSDDLTNAMKTFDSQVKAYGLLPAEVAIRWVAHHSALGDDDAIIIGASTVAQIKETVAMIQKGPLDTKLLSLADELWDAVKPTRGETIA